MTGTWRKIHYQNLPLSIRFVDSGKILRYPARLHELQCESVFGQVRIGAAEATVSALEYRDGAGARGTGEDFVVRKRLGLGFFVSAKIGREW